MSIAGFGQLGSLARRKPPHRIIIARGEHVRTFTIRPWLAGTIAVVGGFLALLYLAATGYLLFRDDLLAASIGELGRMRQAYEDRIATLRADIDRLTSRQLVNQQAFDAKMDRLLGRQAALDARQDMIAGLSQAARRAGVAVIDPAHAADAIVPASTSAAGNDLGIDGADKILPAGTREKDLPVTTGSLEAAPGAAASAAVALLRSSTSVDPLPATGAAARLTAVESSLDALAHSQVSYVEGIASNGAARTDRIAGVLKKIGRSLPQ